MDGKFNVLKSSYYLKKRLLLPSYDGRNDSGLVKLKIDKFQCKCLKSSLELTKIKIDAKGSKSLHKDKSSESLPILLRPMYSTNCDAFKYLIYRSNFVSQVNSQSVYRNGPKCGIAVFLIIIELKHL
jgi:hypothetical protein